MSPPALLPFPGEFEYVARLLSAGYSISSGNARIGALRIIAACLQNSVLVRPPDGPDLAPTFQTAFATDGRSFLQGAIRILLSPLENFCRNTCQPTEGFNEHYNRMRIEELLNMRKSLITDEARAAKAPEEIEKRGAEAQAISQEIEKVRQAKEPGWPQRIAELEAKLASLNPFRPERQLAEARMRKEAAQDSLHRVDGELGVLRLQLGGAVLQDECSWRELRQASTRSFDGGVQHLISASHSLVELSTLSARELSICAGFLHHGMIDTTAPGEEDRRIPRPGMILIQGVKDLLRAVRRPAVRASHLFENFLFFDDAGTGAAPDDTAREALKAMTAWPDLLTSLFMRRCRAGRHLMLLDAAGFEKYLAFKTWCREFQAGGPESIAGYYGHWPHSGLRLALCLQALAGELDAPVLNPALMNVAFDFLKHHAASQSALLQIRDDDAVSVEEQERKLEALEMRLKVQGPLSLRGIVRTYSDQDYARVSRQLNDLIVQKRVERRGSLFFATEVRVSAATDEKCAAGEGGVRL